MDNHIKEVYVGRIDAADATLTAALDAIYDAFGGFYFFTVEDRAEAELLLAAAWAEAKAKPKILIAQSADAAVLAGTAGHIGLDLQAAGYDRTALLWNANSGASDGDLGQYAYRDGAWASGVGGFDLDRRRPPWGFQSLKGQIPDTFTEPQIANLKAANVNVYAEIDGFGEVMTWPGKMASGRRIHTQTSLDWLKRRTQEAIVRLRLNTAKTGEGLGIDLDGLTALQAAGDSVVGQGYDAGHLDRSRPTRFTLPDLSLISDADRQAGLVTLTAAAFFRSETDLVRVDFNVSL